jgi:protocatechuate 3,4-dioxygenase beta subunit
MDAHDRGLAHDLNTLAAALQRRRALRWLAALGGAGLVGCGGGGDATGTTSTTTSPSSGSSSSGSSGSTTCSVIPEETAGPYPGDGSNGINALALSGIVRSDIRSSFAGAGATAAGVPLTLNLTLVNTNGSCADLSGYAIYLWHCDREGRYSLYSAGVTGENYLRGVQGTDTSGAATFTTIFPGCYAGRMPHMHFEVYRDTNTATSYTNKLKTSQIAFPSDACDAVYATSGYAASAANFADISFSTDNVFSDGVSLQTATLTGSPSAGYVATLTVGIGV